MEIRLASVSIATYPDMATDCDNWRDDHSHGLRGYRQNQASDSGTALPLSWLLTIPRASCRICCLRYANLYWIMQTSQSHEYCLTALKAELDRLGFDRNDFAGSLNRNMQSVEEVFAIINNFLERWPKCGIVGMYRTNCSNIYPTLTLLSSRSYPCRDHRLMSLIRRLRRCNPLRTLSDVSMLLSTLWTYPLVGHLVHVLGRLHINRSVVQLDTVAA